MAVGEVGRDLDPLPAFGADRLRFPLQLFGNQPVEQRGVLQPAAVVGLEQVAQDDAAGGLVGLDADELRPLVGGAHRALGEHAADLIRLPGVGALQRLPHLLLARVVGIDRERHELVERHAVLGIDLQQLRRDRGQPQALAHDVDRDEERRGDLLLGLALLAQREEGAELVERMQRRALHVLGEAVLLGEPFGADDAGDRRGAGEALLLHQQLQRPVAPAAGRHLVHAGLGAVSSSTGRTVRLCSSVRRAMSSASSSIDTPALMRRTLDWLRTSLLKGMSRDWLRVIF